MASTVKILYSMSKKRPLGEVLVLISQQGPEILSSLHFVMMCPNGGQMASMVRIL